MKGKIGPTGCDDRAEAISNKQRAQISAPASEPQHDLEAAFLEGAIRGLRRRAQALRNTATAGVTVLDRIPVVLVIESRAAMAFRIARDWDRIADEIEAENGP